MDSWVLLSGSLGGRLCVVECDPGYTRRSFEGRWQSCRWNSRFGAVIILILILQSGGSPLLENSLLLLHSLLFSHEFGSSSFCLFLSHLLLSQPSSLDELSSPVVVLLPNLGFPLFGKRSAHALLFFLPLLFFGQALLFFLVPPSPVFLGQSLPFLLFDTASLLF